MSSGIQITRFPRAVLTGIALLLALTLLAGIAAGEADASKRAKRSAKAKQKVPTITRVDPMIAAPGDKLTVSGRNFVKGKNKMRVLLQRDGSKRRFSALGTATTTKVMTFIVPDIQPDVPSSLSTTPQGTIVTVYVPQVYKLRLISKFGIGAQTKTGLSPTLGSQAAGSQTPGCDKTAAVAQPNADFDGDGLVNSLELQIGTDPCNPDTDGDGVSDYYEYRVALEFNGGPVLPYPGRTPYPNPLYPDSNIDHDGDGMTMVEEYQAWQSTGGRMDQFYSDANQDSNGNGIKDGAEDVDHDLIPNLVELRLFGPGAGPYPLNFTVADTDGDGLCDGLDDQDHDGPPTPVSGSVCQFKLAADTPLTDEVATSIDPTKTYAEDNIYNNWYEWYHGPKGSWFDPCVPSTYPTSPYCPHS